MGRLERLLHEGARRAGRTVEEARLAYRRARTLPRSDGGVRIVCRRHADRRVVDLDDAGRPHCFDPEHPACRGCFEDVQDGTVETW